MRSCHSLALKSLMVFHCIGSNISILHHSHVVLYTISCLCLPLMMRLHLILSPLCSGASPWSFSSCLLNPLSSLTLWSLFTYYFLDLKFSSSKRSFRFPLQCYLSARPSLTTQCRSQPQHSHHITLSNVLNTSHYLNLLSWISHLLNSTCLLI